VLYGSLRRGQPEFLRRRLARRLTYLRTVRLRGVMYDLGDYPGVVLGPGAGLVVGELHRIEDPDLLPELDAFEHYRPDDPASLFVRRTIRVGGLDAEIYLYNGGPASAAVVSGDWLAHRRAQASNSRPMPT
jgi:gamma-glutamylcyclotransferase (GGCT)/AIG2-like uncharacterized protein YtfP